MYKYQQISSGFPASDKNISANPNATTTPPNTRPLNMSDWHGPSTYVIASARDTKYHVTLHNGLKADDTKVITWYVVPCPFFNLLQNAWESTHAKYSRSNLTSKNNHWDFVFAGHGVSGKDEYLIVCRNSGTYLSSARKLAPLALLVDPRG